MLCTLVVKQKSTVLRYVFQRLFWHSLFVCGLRGIVVLCAGVDLIDQIVNVLAMTSVFVGGFTAVVLDNTIPGNTKTQDLNFRIFKFQRK